MTPVKLAAHAALAGLYGGLLVVLLLALMNPGGWPGDGAGLAGLLAVVLTYTLASAFVWPLLYGALRFFASHPLRVPWFSLRYLMAKKRRAP
ncbi:MAG: hypothetical protein DMF50_10180 [Acidobacteria bacterium]|nr:MAG: hypothetical protein DMF50_10180 [Acidobacteriota bacterium]